ncbi:sensor histidine kinase [Vibrio ishigakensis]|uniref:Sensor histidine kinase n=1 Tax=Vibrio ishigakensis TaxID=1481914 RepID=A0A0B8QTI7_9VIBR|nr:sensor histidine kinase [Vibrio ishigakensis]
MAMQDLLQRWGCEVRLAEDMTQTQNQLKDAWRPDVVLSDYRLQDQVTGLDVLKLCRQVVGDEFAGVIISADRTPEIVDRVKYHASNSYLNR